MPALETLLRILERLLWLRGIRRRAFSKGPIALSYHTAGRDDAPASIVLVHGLGTSTLSWVKVLGPLGRRHQVYAIDLPGWGHSPYPSGKDHATIEDLVRAVELFLENVPGRPVALVGQSMGGWVCAKLALRRPDLVQQLVLVNNAGVQYDGIGDLRKRLDVQTHAEVQEFWKDMWHTVPRFYRYFTADYVNKMHEPRVLRFLESVGEKDFLNHELGELRVPVSIVWGMSDRFIPAKTVDIMLQELREARVYWIPECGHIPALERPRQFVRILNGIVPRESPPASPVASAAPAKAPA